MKIFMNKKIVSIMMALVLVFAFSSSVFAGERITVEEINVAPPSVAGKPDILTGDVSVRGDNPPYRVTSLPYNYSANFREYVYTNTYWSPGSDGIFNLYIGASVSSACGLNVRLFEVNGGSVVSKYLGNSTSFSKTLRFSNLNPSKYYFVKFEKTNAAYKMSLSGRAYN